MKALWRIIPLILLWLFSSSGAFGFFGLAEKIASGENFSETAFFASEETPHYQYSCPVDVPHAYDYASGSTVWTFFDPNGLQMSVAGVARGFGMGGSAMQMPAANLAVQQHGTSLAQQQYRMSGSHVIDRTSKDMAKGYVAGMGVATTLGPGPEDALIAGVAKTKL